MTGKSKTYRTRAITNKENDTDHGNYLIIEQLCEIYLTEAAISLFRKAISDKNKTYSMCCGTIQVGFLFARKNTNKVKKPNFMKHNLPQLYMKPSFTVYPMMLTKMFFFSFFPESS